MKRPLIIGLLLAMVLALVSSAIVGGITTVRTSEGSTSSVALAPTSSAPGPSPAATGSSLPGTVVNVSLTG